MRGRPAGVAALLLLLVHLAAACGGGERQPEVLVACAASLVPVMEEVARHHEQETGVRVILSAGASGALARQIGAGSPHDVYLSADPFHMDRLAGRGVVAREDVVTLAEGSLVLAVVNTELGWMSLEDVRSAPLRGLRLGMANPAVAPHGKAARDILEAWGLWEDGADWLVMGDDVGQVYQVARSGQLDAAFLPLSLPRAQGWLALPIPRDLHQPLEVAGAVIRPSPVAAAFMETLASGRGREAFRRHGYTDPGGTPR